MSPSLRRVALLAGLAVAVACGDQTDIGSGEHEAVRSGETAASAPTEAVLGPEVALLASTPLGTDTELHFQPIGAPSVTPAAVRIEHVRGGEVRGAVLPGTRTVLAVADMEPRRERSWGAWLLRLEEGRAPSKLVDRVYHSSTPLVTDTGRVFVQRGQAGDPPSAAEAKAGHLRSDALSIDEVDPATGQAKSVYSWQGYTTHLCGALGSELVVYRVAYQHASLVAVDADSGAVRTLAASIPAFARDFSLDPATGVLLYTNLDEANREWVAQRLDLKSSVSTTLERSPHMALAPHHWVGGGVVMNAAGAPGLVTLGGSGASLSRPLGAGVDVVRDLLPDGSWAVVSHERPSVLPVPFAVKPETGEVLPLAVPPGRRVSIAGFVR